MSKWTETLTDRVAAKLGETWTVEAPSGWGALIVTHRNGSRVLVSFDGEDGRRNATEGEAAEYVERLTRKLRGEVPKYTAEWAEKARAALQELAA